MSTASRPSAAAPAPAARLGGGLTGRMLLASSLLMLILAATFAVLLVAVADLRGSAHAARRSEEVLATANELERLVIDLETGVRGFVLTGQGQFLEPWDDARRNLPARAAALERLSAGNPEQARTARRITQAAGAYVEQYAAPLVQAGRRGDPAARTVAATAEGKRRVDAVRADFDAFIATERGLALARQERSDAAARRAVAAAVGGLAVSLVLVLVFAGYLTRAIVRPVLRAAQLAGRLAGGDLSARMPATGVAEIGRLERAFNQMAGSMERDRDELAKLAAELAASRARVVAAADQTRRRLERDLHDGAQQRLVALALQLQATTAAVPLSWPRSTRSSPPPPPSSTRSSTSCASSRAASTPPSCPRAASAGAAHPGTPQPGAGGACGGDRGAAGRARRGGRLLRGRRGPDQRRQARQGQQRPGPGRPRGRQGAAGGARRRGRGGGPGAGVGAGGPAGPGGGHRRPPAGRLPAGAGHHPDRGAPHHHRPGAGPA